MFFFGALAFLVAEVASFIAVGDQIGFGWALLVLFGVSAIGPLVIRRVGMGIVARTQERLVAGEVPTREVLDGVVVLAGGLMLVVPGFISDALGLLLMIGPVRHAVIRGAGHRVARRVQSMRTGPWTVIDIRSRPTPDGRSEAWPMSAPMIESGTREDGIEGR